MSQTEKKRIPESVIDIACVIVSWLILFILPSEEGIFLYALIGISAFLFCIGFFRFLNNSSLSVKQNFDPRTAAALACAGAVMNIIGYIRILADQGSAGSIMLATVLLIESLVFYGMAFGSAETPGMKRKISIGLKAAAVLMALGGIWYLIRKDFSEASIMFGGMLMIQAIVFWAMGCGNDPFSREMVERCGVKGMNTSAEDLLKEFGEIKTQLGTPWLAELKTVPGKAIIYGPTEDHYFIYGCSYPGKFMVFSSDGMIFKDPEVSEQHTVTETANAEGVLLDRENLPEAYAQMFRRYHESGVKKWDISLSYKTEKKKR